MRLTVQPQEFEDVRIPAGMNVRIQFESTAQIDAAILTEPQYEIFSASDDGAETTLWVEQSKEAAATMNLPDEPHWLILWNAYEEIPVSVDYSVVPTTRRD